MKPLAIFFLLTLSAIEPILTPLKAAIAKCEWLHRSSSGAK